MKIKILGEELEIKFNLATEIAFEQITGGNFDIESLKNPLMLVALYHASIIANNKDTAITYEDLMKKASAKELTILRKAVFESMDEWVAGSEPPKEDNEEGEGGQEKNS